MTDDNTICWSNLSSNSPSSRSTLQVADRKLQNIVDENSLLVFQTDGAWLLDPIALVTFCIEEAPAYLFAMIQHCVWPCYSKN